MTDKKDFEKKDLIKIEDIIADIVARENKQKILESGKEVRNDRLVSCKDNLHTFHAAKLLFNERFNPLNVA